MNTFKINMIIRESISETDKIKIVKIKSRLSSCNTKIVSAQNHLKSHLDILEGIATNNSKSGFILFVYYLNQLLLINSEDNSVIGNDASVI